MGTVREGQEEDGVRQDLDPRFLAEAATGMLNMALVGWLNDPAYPFGKRLARFTELIGELIRGRAT